jgi:hypothetical protein
MLFLTHKGKLVNFNGGLMVSSVNSFPAPPAGPPPLDQSGISQTGLQGYFMAGSATSYPGTGTTWFDLTTNNNDLTIDGATHVTSPVSAFDFDGTNDKADGGDVLDWGTGDISIGYWINADTVAAGYQYVVSKSIGGNVASRYGVGINNAAPFFFVMTTDTGDGTMLWESNTNLSVSTWHYVVYTTNRAGSQVNIYIDGQAVTASRNAAGADLDRTEGENINSTHPFWLGATPTSDGTTIQLPFNGKIAEVHWYNTRLSAAQVLANYNGTKTFYE